MITNPKPKNIIVVKSPTQVNEETVKESVNKNILKTQTKIKSVL